MAATTGMLMVGKISVAVRTIASAPNRKIRMARTMNVYGRCSAIRTIHMHNYSRARTSASGVRIGAASSGLWVTVAAMLAFRCGAEQGPAQGQVEMINYVMVGTNRFDAAVVFYDALMTDMGATRAYSPG